MITLRVVLFSSLSLIAPLCAMAHSPAPLPSDNVHKEWVYIIKCTEPESGQSERFQSLMAHSTVMKQNAHEIILLVSQSTIDSFNITECGCITQKSMPLFRSIASNEDAQAKTELIATQKSENDSLVVLKLLFNRHPDALYSTLIPMHAASMTLLPEFDQVTMDFELFELKE